MFLKITEDTKSASNKEILEKHLDALRKFWRVDQVFTSYFLVFE